MDNEVADFNLLFPKTTTLRCNIKLREVMANLGLTFRCYYTHSAPFNGLARFRLSKVIKSFGMGSIVTAPKGYKIKFIAAFRIDWVGQ